MSNFDKLVEEKIKEAMDNGQFDNLPGKGKPLDLGDYFKAPPHLRAGYSLLKNANVVPAEIQLKKEIEALKEMRKTNKDENKKSGLTKKINEKTTELNLLLERPR